MARADRRDAMLISEGFNNGYAAGYKQGCADGTNTLSGYDEGWKAARVSVFAEALQWAEEQVRAHGVKGKWDPLPSTRPFESKRSRKKRSRKTIVTTRSRKKRSRTTIATTLLQTSLSQCCSEFRSDSRCNAFVVAQRTMRSLHKSTWERS